MPPALQKCKITFQCFKSKSDNCWTWRVRITIFYLEIRKVLGRGILRFYYKSREHSNPIFRKCFNWGWNKENRVLGPQLHCQSKIETLFAHVKDSGHSVHSIASHLLSSDLLEFSGRHDLRRNPTSPHHTFQPFKSFK